MPYYFSAEQKEGIKKAVQYALQYDYKPEHDYVREFLAIMPNTKTKMCMFNNASIKFAIEQLKIDYRIAKQEKEAKTKVKEKMTNSFWD